MKKYLSAVLCCGILVLSAGAALAETAKAPLKSVNKAGEVREVGVITFTDTPEGLLMDVDVFDLPAGTHKLGLREKPDCAPARKGHKGQGGDAVDAAKDAKVLQVNGEPCEPPDLTVGADGKAKAQHVAPGVKVSDVRNHAIVIHKKTAEPHRGGARLACGVVR